MPFVILTRRRHLDDMTFFAFAKRAILKRKNVGGGSRESGSAFMSNNNYPKIEN
jgi:hypothetical protein